MGTVPESQELISPNPPDFPAPKAAGPDKAQPKLLDQVRSLMRLQHYSIHTERSYVDWIKRFVQFHRIQSRADLVGGEEKIEAFLTDLAVQGKVSASTQNQAMHALVFLVRERRSAASWAI